MSQFASPNATQWACLHTYISATCSCTCLFTMPQRGPFCSFTATPPPLLTAYLSSAYMDESRQTLYPVLDCRKVNLKLRATNQNVFNLSMDASVALSSLPSEACGALVAVAANVGNTKVTVALDTKAFGRLEATVTVAAYPPLTVSVVCTCMHALFLCTCL